MTTRTSTWCARARRRRRGRRAARRGHTAARDGESIRRWEGLVVGKGRRVRSWSGESHTSHAMESGQRREQRRCRRITFFPDRLWANRYTHV